MMTTKNAREAYEAILHEAALAEAESRDSTPAEKRIAQRVATRVRNDLAKMRRDQLPAPDPILNAKPIRPSLYKRCRDELLAIIDRIVSRMGGAVQYAHCDLSGLSDDDLRQLITLLDPNATE
jgi:hypothetical protein